MRWGFLAVGLGLALAALPERAEAQYRNFNFGFEGGYFLLSPETGLKAHNFAIGMFGGYKVEDHWWFNGRAMVSFPGQPNQPNTVVLLHLVPASVRYYFQTDAFRPFVGVTNSFQLLFNHTTNHDAMWGPGVTAGVEFKLRRDLFLGFQGDAFWMFIFEGDDAQIVSVNAQLIFFL